MSQIFDALRRSRERDRHDGTANRNAQADAVLATMGFASERKPGPRTRLAPLLVLLLLTVTALLGWRWYTDDETHPTANQPASPSVARSAPQPGPAPSLRVDAPSPGVTQQRPLSADTPEASQNPDTDENPGNPRRSTNPTSPTTPADPFQLAVYYHRAGELDSAMTQYRAVLQRNELNPQAHNNLGLLYREKGQLEDAVRHFERALLIDGRYLAARNNLGVALLGQGRVEEASAEFKRVISRDPQGVDAIVNLALAEKSAGRPDVAMETLIRAIVVDQRNAPAHYNLAVLYEQAREAARAVEHYRAFLDCAGPEHAAIATEVRGRLAELAKDPEPPGKDTIAAWPRSMPF